MGYHLSPGALEIAPRLDVRDSLSHVGQGLVQVGFAGGRGQEGNIEQVAVIGDDWGWWRAGWFLLRKGK